MKFSKWSYGGANHCVRLLQRVAFLVAFFKERNNQTEHCNLEVISATPVYVKSFYEKSDIFF